MPGEPPTGMYRSVVFWPYAFGAQASNAMMTAMPLKRCFIVTTFLWGLDDFVPSSLQRPNRIPGQAL